MYLVQRLENMILQDWLLRIKLKNIKLKFAKYKYTGNSVMVFEHVNKTYKLFGVGPYNLPACNKVKKLLKQGLLESESDQMKKVLEKKYKVKDLK